MATYWHLRAYDRNHIKHLHQDEHGPAVNALMRVFRAELPQEMDRIVTGMQDPRSREESPVGHQEEHTGPQHVIEHN